MAQLAGNDDVRAEFGNENGLRADLSSVGEWAVGTQGVVFRIPLTRCWVDACCSITIGFVEVFEHS